MAKYKYVHQISGNIHRNKSMQSKFLKWINGDPKFKRRKPTVEETVREMRQGCLKDLVKQSVDEAAAEYWKSEAQYWLRHVEIVKLDLTISEDVGKPIKAYIPIKVSANGHIKEEDYIPARRVESNVNMKLDVVAQARADLEAWIARYERYTEFFEVFDPVVKSIRRLTKKLDRKSNVA